MALDSTPRLPTNLYDDQDDDVMSMTTSTAVMMSEDGVNMTKKFKCNVGEDVTERITVVSVIMICTIVGNLALILALTCKRSRRIKRVNVFLVNLAIGDLAVAIFTNTTEILFLAFGDWALGPAACKISVYMQIVTLASATFLLTAMSMDRYQVIVKPLQSLAQRPRIWMKVAIAWIMAFIFATPQLFIFLQITEDQGGVKRRCCVSKGYTKEWQRKVYLTFLTSYILLVPTAIMIYCYANIIHVIWIRARAGDGTHVKHVHRVHKDESPDSPRMSMRRGLITASKRRVITMTLTVVVGFLVCQTPYFIVSLVRVYSDYGIRLPAFLALSENIVLMHSTLNPVFYGLFTLRSYHFDAFLHCFTGKETPVSVGERRLLLHGKYASNSSKSASSSRRTDVQIYRKAIDDTLCKSNGVCHVAAANKDGTVCNDSAACKDGIECTDKTTFNETGKKNGARKRDKGRKQDSGSDIPVLLIANTAAVEDCPDKMSPSEDKDQHKLKRNSVSDKPQAVKWEQDTHCVVQRGAYGNDRPAISCSQWTPCYVEGNSECYSCV